MNNRKMRIAVYNLRCTKDKHSNGVKFSNGDICFNLFLNQNYELQFSCNVIITCNNKQYIVNYKQQFSFSYYS
jgi:hypothetical protein